MVCIRRVTIFLSKCEIISNENAIADILWEMLAIVDAEFGKL